MSKRKIKQPLDDLTVRRHEDDRILFSFKQLVDLSYVDCKDPAFFKSFLKRVRAIERLGWKSVHISGRHQYGYEPIPVKSLRINKSAYPALQDLDTLQVFRATGSNHAFLGFREQNIFYILFIEAEFGDLYTHS